MAASQEVLDYPIGASIDADEDVLGALTFDEQGENVLYTVASLSGFEFDRVLRASTLATGNSIRIAPNLPMRGIPPSTLANQPFTKGIIQLLDFLDSTTTISVAPLNGDNAIQLSQVVDQDFGSLVLFNNDGDQIFYNSRTDDETGTGLFLQAINGLSQRVRLDTQNTNDTDSVTLEFAVTDNESHAIFSTFSSKLFSRNLLNGNVNRIDADGIVSFLSNQFLASRFAVSSNNSRVVYVADPAGGQSIPFGQYNLFSTDLNGADRQQINPAGSLVTNFFISPDGASIIYRANQNSSTFEIFISPVEGGQSTRISLPINQNTDEEIESFNLSGDGNLVTYSVFSQNGGYRRTFIINLLDSFRVVELPGSNIQNFAINDSETQVAFVVGENFGFRSFTAYVGSLETGSFSTFSIPGRFQGIDQIEFFDDDSLLFLGEDENFRSNLFAYSFENEELLRLNREFTIVDPNSLAFGVERYWQLRNSNRVVYLGDTNTTGRNELFGIDFSQIEFEPVADEFCFPIVAGNGNTSVICL